MVNIDIIVEVGTSKIYWERNLRFRGKDNEEELFSLTSAIEMHAV